MSPAQAAERIIRWVRDSRTGLARVTHSSDAARRATWELLKAAAAPDSAVEIKLPDRVAPSRLASQVRELLEAVPGGLVSVPWTLSVVEPPLDLEKALSGVSLLREALADLPLHQVWWMSQEFTDRLTAAVPDLESWFVLRLSVEVPVVAVGDGNWISSSDNVSDPAEARRQANSLVSRAREAFFRGEPADLVWTQLVTPAISVLNASSLQAEAREIEREFRPALRRLSSPVHVRLDALLDPGSLPAIWNVRRERNPYFTGRDEWLRRLRENLEAQHGAVLTQAIAGLGGVGKTTLATEYAYEFAAEYDVVWELPCEDTASARLALAELAVRLGVEPDTGNPQAWESAREWLEQHGRWLLLCDNAVSYDAIAGLLPRGGQRGHVLITSRNPNWRKLGMEPLSLPPLSPAEGAQFLLRRTGRAAASDEAEAQGLSQDLGGLPLALELAAAYVEENAISLARYRARLAEAPLRLLEPVARTWEISLGKLPPAAVRLLERLAFLAPDAIPRGLLEGWDLGADDGSHLDEAVGALRRYSLVTVEPDGSLGVHRLLQRVIRSRLADPAAVCSAGLRHVNEGFGYDQEKIETWEPADPLYEHAVAAALHAAEQGVEPEKTSRLLNQAGLLAMNRRADLGAALPLLQRALAIAEKSFGPDHPEVAIRANNIGQILKAQGDLEGALSYTRRALAFLEKSFGPDHPMVATLANNIGNILQAQGDLEGALTYTRRALAIDEKSFGPEHPDVARGANNIGSILHDQSDLEGALAYTRRALAIWTKFLGPDHPNTRRAAANLAAIERDAKR